MTQAMNWGETKGEAQSNRATFMKMEATNRIRIVGDIVRKYDYWIKNAKGNSLPFENLDFDRDTESFVQGNRNPIKEAGLQNVNYKGQLEFDEKTGAPVPMKSSKAYVCPVINRKTNQVEYMALKKGVFDGINEVMGKLNDPKQRKRFVNENYQVVNPMFVDIIFTKTGQGIDTRYSVDLLEVMDEVTDVESFEMLMALHEKDKALLEDMKSPEEMFPRRTYEEQKAALEKHLAMGTEDEEEKEPNDAAQEALNELD